LPLLGREQDGFEESIVRAVVMSIVWRIEALKLKVMIAQLQFLDAEVLFKYKEEVEDLGNSKANGWKI
jgi:hypothetical protein